MFTLPTKTQLIAYSAIAVIIFSAGVYSHNTLVSARDQLISLWPSSHIKVDNQITFINIESDEEKAKSEIKHRQSFIDFVDLSAHTVYLREQKELHKAAEDAEHKTADSFAKKQTVEVTRASDSLNALLGDQDAIEHVTAMKNIGVIGK